MLPTAHGFDEFFGNLYQAASPTEAVNTAKDLLTLASN